MWKVLIVDDVFVNRQLLVEILNDIAKCDVAANGKEAIEALNYARESDPYDLILLDIAMPEISGLEFLELLRENEKKAGISLGDGVPVIMVTAHKESFIKAFNDGCDDYILKPIDPDILVKKVKTILGEKK